MILLNSLLFLLFLPPLLFFLLLLFFLQLFLLFLRICFFLWLHHLFVECLLHFGRVGKLGHQGFLGSEDLTLKIDSTAIDRIILLVERIIPIEHMPGLELFLLAGFYVEDFQGSGAVECRCCQVRFGHKLFHEVVHGMLATACISGSVPVSPELLERAPPVVSL